MQKNSPLSHFSPNLMVSPWRNGIKLIPPRNEMAQSYFSVETLMRMPFNVYFKSTDSIMVVVNTLTDATCGPAGTICGGWSKEIRNKIVLNDKIILQTQQKNILSEKGISSEGEPMQALSFKFPWYSQDNTLLGLFGCSIITNFQAESSLAQQFHSLMQTGLLEPAANIKLPKPQLIINHPLLSKREKDCLYYLIRGKTTKEIARMYGLSFRTVESYLSNIKNKLNVTSKSELIEKVLEHYTTY